MPQGRRRPRPVETAGGTRGEGRAARGGGGGEGGGSIGPITMTTIKDTSTVNTND